MYNSIEEHSFYTNKCSQTTNIYKILLTWFFFKNIYLVLLEYFSKVPKRVFRDQAIRKAVHCILKPMICFKSAHVVFVHLEFLNTRTIDALPSKESTRVLYFNGIARDRNRRLITA